MQPETNPYQSPIAVGVEAPAVELRRPVMGTVLIGIWILEGGFKACLVAAGLLSGWNPLHSLALEYPSWNRLLFFLMVSFFTVETIGPWIGIYYLTGRRSRTIPFDTALVRTLLVAGGIGIAATLLLILYCELANLWR